MCDFYDAVYTSVGLMKIHILGIGGTFMAGIAIIAKQLGHQVTGSDKNLYDPMKTVLKKSKINYASFEDVQFAVKYPPSLVPSEKPSITVCLSPREDRYFLYWSFS